MTSIKNFCERINSKYTKIDFLANNAGGGNSKFTKTVDGFDQNLTVNYLGHFTLTTQLLPTLKDGSRIVTFSSIGYKRFLKHNLDVDNLMCTDASQYNQMQEYCKAKLCAILFGVKLQKEFERIGSSSMALSCHPGWARTNLMNNSDSVAMRIMGKIMNSISGAIGLSQDLYNGALPAIEALITDEPKPNMVYSPSKRESTGVPIPIEIDKTHFKEEDIDKLWDKTQKILTLKVSDYLE